MLHDSFVSTGRAHEREGGVCQDYATSLDLKNGGVLLAVSDGCSMSKRSDFGSRLWIKAVESLRSEEPDFLLSVDRDYLRTVISGRFVSMASALGLRPEDCLATLVMCVSFAGRTRFLGWGDGGFGWKTSGDSVSCKVDWSGNAPPYPYYSVSPKDSSAFLEMGQTGTMSVNEEEFALSSTEGLQGWERTVEGASEAWVSTDGVFSFGDGVSPENFLSFKTIGGVFLKRRCIRERASLSARGICNSDDFAMSVFVEES